MSKPAPLLILIDGSSYLYRAFHALPPLTSPTGEPTGALYGVINMVKKLLSDHQPDYVAVVFDTKGETFRDELYGDYKAHREAMPDDLVLQIEPLHELVRAMGLPLLAIEKVEADDVIGTLTTEARKRQWRVLISTGDKDMAQLVTPDVTLINTMTNLILDPPGVEKKFGLAPEKMIDYLSLVGDTSDNIPGVPGVGPKTAVKWLTQYESLDNLLAHSQEITGKVGERLRENQDKLPLWKTLVTIKTDVALPITLDELKPQPESTPLLRELFTRFGFKNWLKQLQDNPETKVIAASLPCQVINTPNDFNDLLSTLSKESLIGIDMASDTQGTEHKIIGLCFYVPEKINAYLPLQHLEAKNLPINATLSYLKEIFENPQIKKLAYDLKTQKNLLAYHDIHLKGLQYDILIENYLLHSGQSKQDLDSLITSHLQKSKKTYEEIAGKGQKKLNFDQLDVAISANYCIESLRYTWELNELFWPQISAIPNLLNVYNTIELPLISTLSHMETQGVLIDCHLLQEQSKELGKRLTEIEEKVYKMAGKVFNLASPKQLQEILYEDLKLPVLQRTATGQPSTAEEVLQTLALDYPLPSLILEYRMLSKLKSTYTDALPLEVNPRSHRIHTSYNQAGTSTGRLSSSNPNLQNIPIRNEEGRRIRKAFISPKNKILISADYSQIELRLMAHFSKDKKLVGAFSDGEDIHRATAAEVIGITPKEVNAEQRRQAKVINFGILYGMSAFGLAKELQLSREAAQAYIDRYFQRYPGVHDYMESVRHFAHQHGYVETLLGRRIYVPEINDRNFQRQKASERAAINGPLQGTAADMIKLAMNSLDAALRKELPDAHMIMQVHDELVVEAPEENLEQVAQLMRIHMTKVVKLDVPLLVEIASGKNWEEAHG